MQNNIVTQYMKFNNILLSTIDFKAQSVELFDGEKTTVFDYDGFVKFLADYFNLSDEFITTSKRLFEDIEKNEGFIKVKFDVKGKDGNDVFFLYNFIKQDESHYLLSIKKEIEKQHDNVDQLTQANTKEYIDNKAKNYMLIKTPFVVIYCDIDNFKQVNDDYGGEIGDMILMEMVAEMKNVIGNKGAVARIGGDRFLIIYEIEDDYDKVHDFIFDFKYQIQKLPTCTSRGIKITVTLGSAQYPRDGVYALLLKKCQKALIRGKNKGRDCFIMYLEEKCGKVTINDVIVDRIVKIDSQSSKNSIYSLITSINQLLIDDKNLDESIDKAISLVGNYFYIDRIAIARLDIKTNRIKKTHVWYHPKITNKHQIYCEDKLIPAWREAQGAKDYVKIDDVKELSVNHPLKNILPIDHTTANMSFELVVNGKTFGIIRLDMTTGVRHWQPEDFQVFLLISQLFASYIQKNYINETNYNTLFLDPKYNCYNFTKMFSVAGEAIINNKVRYFSIVEFNIRGIIKIKSILGEKRMVDLVDSILNVLNNTPNVIYGKYHEGPFVLFFMHQNTDLINETLKKVESHLADYSKMNHLYELDLQTGIAFGDANFDRLIDVISNAKLTRTLNKTNEPLCYSSEIREKALFKTKMILRIDEALENKEFLLYLQPKISTKDGTLIGAEALTRWKYKHEKLLFPDQFIPIFEEEGVIEKLDYSVFENVCIYQNNLKKEGKKLVPISVNVSRYVSDFNGYISRIENIRKKYDVDAKYIEIEITEGMYFENLVPISNFIEKLHSLGYKVSMDDFGSGYSNLVSLAKLSFDTIKFDKSFCMGLDNNNVKIMLDKLIDLIKMLKMHTICEGVETKENVDYLTKIGCDSIQGYYYSKPIPYTEFKEKYYNDKNS